MRRLIVILTALTLLAPVSADEPVKENNVVVKVIVHTPATVYEEPDESKEIVGDLEPSEIRYLLRTEDGDDHLEVGGVVWRRIGREPNAADGWIRDDSVYLWKTRSALEPRRRPGLIFRVTATDKDFGPLVLPNGEFDVYEHSGATGSQSVAPILEPRVNEEDPYHVCFFVLGEGDPAAVDSNPGRTTASDPSVSEDLVVEIVFVIDTTSSMTPLLDGVKDIVTQTAERLAGDPAFAGREAPLRFGLVEYQDATPGLIPAQVTIPLTSAVGFSERIQSVHVARDGSVEWNEDVIAGLSLALTSDLVDWSENSSKNIVLIGDASQLPPGNAKNSTPFTYEDVFAQARADQGGTESAGQLRKVFDFHAIYAIDSAQTHPEVVQDRPLCAEQFQAVSKAGSIQGYYEQVDVTDTAAKEEACNGLVDQFLKATRLAADPGSVDPNAPPDESEPFVLAVWKRQGQGTAPPEPVPLGLARAVDESDAEVANESIFVRREEIEEFASLLNFLITKLDDFSDRAAREDAERFLNSLNQGFAAVHLGEDMDLNTPLADKLGVIPLKNDSLNLTVQSLSQMEDEAYQSWLNDLRSTQDVLQGYVDDEDSWDPLGEDGDVVRYLRFDELP